MDILKEFLNTSTIHGLAYISNVSSKTGKALWLIIVIAGFCTAGYLIASSYQDWESSPVSTSISTHPIASLPLPIITICPPENSNTVLNVDLVRAGNITLAEADREALINVSRQFLIHEPSYAFVELARKMANKEAIPQLKAETRSYPIPYENKGEGINQAFEVWSAELNGTYTSPGFGSARNCSEDYPNIHFTLYIPQKVTGQDLINDSFELEILTEINGDFEVEYREGDKYIFYENTNKVWTEAENHCKEQRGHLVSIKTNDDYNEFRAYQKRDNKKGKNLWLGGNDRKVESIWEWSDGTRWVNESKIRCSKIVNLEKHGLQSCTNWENSNPSGGKELNCLIMNRQLEWLSHNCERQLPYWCHIPPRKLGTNKKFSGKLADIKFSKIELWLKRRLSGAEMACSDTKKMPGFSMTWSTISHGNNDTRKIFKVSNTLQKEKKYKDAKQISLLFSYMNKKLVYTILAFRKANMTTQNIWDITRNHKRELVEANKIGCNLGHVGNDGFSKLFGDLEEKIPKNAPEVAYTESVDDYALAVDLFSYLIFCQSDQMKMAAFYNNLFHTANARTILQTTVNNIQLGMEKPNIMVALHQIYRILAKKMELKLPYILQGFLDSKKETWNDPQREIFFEKGFDQASQATKPSFLDKYHMAF